MTKHGAITPARCRSRPTSRRCCPISACPTCSPRICRKAEETLRQAQASGRADARVRQNLALAVGLQGRFAEAETIVKADLPPDEAAANVAYLKQMLTARTIRAPRRAASRRWWRRQAND